MTFILTIAYKIMIFDFYLTANFQTKIFLQCQFTLHMMCVQKFRHSLENSWKIVQKYEIYNGLFAICSETLLILRIEILWYNLKLLSY